MIKATYPTILIINFHSTKNAGDFSLLMAAVDILNAAFESPRIIVSANWPNENAYRDLKIEVVPSFWTLAGVSRDKNIIKQIHKLLWSFLKIALLRKQKNNCDVEPNLLPWRQLLMSYQCADLVVGVSGNQFYSTGRFGWPFPASMCSVAMAHIYKKPLYILPQSIGPLKRVWEKMFLRSTYRKARKVFLRDNKSMQLAKEIGLPLHKVDYAPDPAFQLKPALNHEALNILKGYGYTNSIPALGVTIIAPMGHSLVEDEVKNYYSVITSGLEKFLRTYNAKVMIFNQVSGPTINEDDSYFSEMICKKLQNKSLNIIHVNEQLNPRLLKACYGYMTAFVASRLHSGIFSLSMLVPTLFIGYLSKTKGLLNACGLDDSLVEIKDLTEELFWEKLTTIWGNLEAEKAKIKIVLPNILAETTKPGEFIRKDFLHG